VTSKNYTDLFPREELIYLSPDAEKELEAIESDKVYIIGGIVDRVHEPRISKFASFETANSDGVEARKLPLDTYVEYVLAK
jgi:Trm5-related predicted tRNA methylase